MQHTPSPTGPRPGSGGRDWRGQPRGGYVAPSGALSSGAYLKSAYLDDRGWPRPDLLTVEAKQVAEELAYANPPLAYGQMRRFFGIVRFIESRLAANEAFQDLRWRLAGLRPLAADAVKRKVAPPIFQAFIDRNVELSLGDERSFKLGFVQHFQSVVCYFPRKSGG